LTHDVAYENVLQDRRRSLHGRIVAAVERLYPDRLVEHAEQLAHHALRAEDWEAAVRYSRDAGAKAFARSANAEALEAFQRALGALQRLPESQERLLQRIDLCFQARNSLSLLGELERIAPYLGDAERLARALADQHRLGWASVYMANYLWQTGRSSDAHRYAKDAKTISSAAQDPFLEAWANMNLGYSAQTSGDLKQALEFFAEVVELLRGNLASQRRGWTGFPAPMARSYLAWCLAERGLFEDALAQGRESIRLAEGTNHPYTMAYVRFAVGFAHLIKGDSRESSTLLEQSLALCEEWQLAFLKPFLIWALGYAYALSGRADDGLLSLRQALTTYEARGFRAYRSYMLVHLSEASLLKSRIEDACQFSGRALSLARERGERSYEGYALRVLGELASRTDADPAVAEAHYRRALVIADDLGMRPLVAHCHAGLARLYQGTAKPQAHEHLATATTMYRDMKMQFYLQNAETRMH
jgi:tetratricopeptide (TPR) repeat protein